MSNPTVSVVIPAFNAAKFIRRTISSILAQTYIDFEIIVVDDGSSDNTGEMVKSYGEKVGYIYQKNAGDGPARSTGIQNARGEWIALMDHDDEWMPEKLHMQMELLKGNPQLRWCASNFYRQLGDARSLACDFKTLEKAMGNHEYFEDVFTAMANKDGDFMTSTMMIHREVFKKVGVFDSCWLRVADHDMWWRIGYAFAQIGYVHEPLAILHLDVQDSVGTNLRLKTKTGQDDRALMTKHLKLAAEYGRLEMFKPCAKMYMLRSLKAVIFHGFKKDARIMVMQFRELLGLWWVALTYLLTLMPVSLISMLASLAYKLGFERQVSRRWITPRINN